MGSSDKVEGVPNPAPAIEKDREESEHIENFGNTDQPGHGSHKSRSNCTVKAPRKRKPKKASQIHQPPPLAQAEASPDRAANNPTQDSQPAENPDHSDPDNASSDQDQKQQGNTPAAHKIQGATQDLTID